MKNFFRSAFLVLCLSSFGATAFSSENCLMPMPAQIRGPGVAWIITDLNESHSKVQKVHASYWYSVVQQVHPEIVYEEAVVDRIVSGDAVYYRGVSTKSGLLIEVFGKVGYIPSKLRFNGSMVELLDLRGCDY